MCRRINVAKERERKKERIKEEKKNVRKKERREKKDCTVHPRENVAGYLYKGLS